jgi:hypothetical protein
MKGVLSKAGYVGFWCSAFDVGQISIPWLGHEEIRFR